MKPLIPAVFGLFLFCNLDVQAQGWTVGGNDLATNGRLGTNNDVDVLFESNNAVRGRLTKKGVWVFGTSAPTAAVNIGSAEAQDGLKIQVGNAVKLLVDDAGGTSVGGGATPPADGLLVAGNTGFGATPGSYKVKVVHGTFGMNIENVTTGDDWELWSNSGGLSIYADGSFRGNFSKSTGAYTAISDDRFKTNVQAMPAVLAKIRQLQPSTYQFQQDGLLSDGSVAYGFIAQDVATVFPHMVQHHYDHERGLDAYTMDYSGFGVLAIKAIQELQDNVTSLEARIADLEAALQGYRRLAQ